MKTEKIFEFANEISRLVQYRHKISEIQAKIRGKATKKCGDCAYWMKNSCVPEKQYKQFKSCGSLACKDFVLSWFSYCLLRKWKQELVVLKSRDGKVS